MSKDSSAKETFYQMFALAFQKYASVKVGRNLETTELPDYLSTSVYKDFTCLVQYLQFIKNPYNERMFNDAEVFTKITTNTPITDPAYDKLMHFMAVNPVEIEVVRNFMSSWKITNKEINLADENKITPLNFAIERGKMDFVIAMYENGVDITAIDAFGSSALRDLVELASKDKDFAIPAIKMWLAAGLPTNMHSEKLGTALELAKDHQLQVVIDILEPYSANDDTAVNASGQVDD